MVTNPTSISVTVEDPTAVDRFEVQYYHGDTLACKLDIEKPELIDDQFTLPLTDLNRMVAPTNHGVELSLWVACKQGTIRTASTQAQATVMLSVLPTPTPPTAVSVE